MKNIYPWRQVAALLLLCSVLLIAVPAHPPQQLRAQPVVSPRPAVDQLLAIDDGTADNGVGGSGDPGFGWFNQLKPDSYPATLKEVLIAFNNSRDGIPSGSPIKVVVYRDPEEDGPSPNQRPDIVFSVTANSPGSYERYELPQTVTIDSGAFIVGAVDTLLVAELPALIDQPGTVTPAGRRSFFTLDNGVTFSRVDQTFPNFGIAPGSWLVRAVVEVASAPPVITRAFYRKNKLRIIGRNFAAKATVRINGERIKLSINFNKESGKLTIKGSPSDLNLKPAGQVNRLVVIVDGVASEVFQFTT
ncbi:MAG: hypothetical protein AB1489_10125 [Acidobacteriota bacterium]